jgi:thermostable 8-oxoguanine DNA glycosylase
VQKSAYLAAALSVLEGLEEPADYVAFRDRLTELPGVGLKTASWITRNVRDSDNVAILDVHVCRACELAGVFPSQFVPARDYRVLEQRFLAFARAVGVRASVLDALIWENMRRFGRLNRRPSGSREPYLSA